MIDTSDKQLNDEAAQWLIRLEDAERPASARQQAAFFAWLQRSPRHLQAFFESADLWHGLEDFDKPHDIDLDQLLAGRPATVTSLVAASDRSAESAATATAGRRARPRRQLGRWGGALTAAALLAGVLAGWTLIPGHDRYDTATGEQRTVKLSDGSVVELNTQSRITVAYSGEQRLIELQRGEALFSVEHDPDRPFLVRTRSATVRALGTQFNVLDRASGTTVTVVEGAVQVSRSSPTAARETARLAAGEAATVAPERISRHRLDTVDAAVAWRERRLVFDNASLDEVAAEFNRYNTLQIHTTDGIGQRKRITGIFSADHPQSLILFLRKEPQLIVEETAEGIVVRDHEAVLR